MTVRKPAPKSVDFETHALQEPEVREAYTALLPVTVLVEHAIAIRKARGLTQRTLAERLGVSQSAVSQFESGNVDPKWTTVVRTLDALGAAVCIVPKGDDIVVMQASELARQVDQLIHDALEHYGQKEIAAALVRRAKDAITSEGEPSSVVGRLVTV